MSDPVKGDIPDSVSRDGAPVPESFLQWEAWHKQQLKDHPPPDGTTVHVTPPPEKGKHGKHQHSG